MARLHKNRGGNYRQNHGVAGVVYILHNMGLREGFYKIGCSRRSGNARANDLNADANTGTPGSFQCIFEYRTKDCGKAEEQVFQQLAHHRRGKWGQEFFEVSLAHAKATIIQVCIAVDKKTEEDIQTPNVATKKSEPAVSRTANSEIHQAIPAPPRKATTPILTGTNALVVLGILIAISWFSGVFDKNSTLNQDSAPKPATTILTLLPPSPPRKVDAENNPSLVTGGHANSTSAKISNIQQATTDIADFNAPPGIARHSFESQNPERDENASARELTTDEKSSIESVCARDKFSRGPVAYNQCVERQIDSLRKEISR